jgi:hypothetical protein
VSDTFFGGSVWGHLFISIVPDIIHRYLMGFVSFCQRSPNKGALPVLQ